MDTSDTGYLAQREVATDLRASVNARRELGPEMEDHLIEAFLARIEQRVDLHVAQHVAGQKGSRPLGRPQDQAPNVGVIVGSLGVAIPLLAIAGGIAGGFGIFAVMLAVVAVNLLYFVDRWVRFST